ncbi:MAG: epoxyqueuosine reductase QueH [Elusimicrobiota bacterium]
MILLHHCCVVCTPKVLEILRQEFKEVTGLWYNPNIMPEEEYFKRLNALKVYSEEQGHYLIIEDDSVEDWWMENVKKIEEEGKDRCEFCYYIRLKRTARKTKEMGFKKFTTTLLSSHHQKHNLIREMGELTAEEDGVEFYYKDFRPFFYEGKNAVYIRGLYIQKYCGCVFSMVTHRCLRK